MDSPRISIVIPSCNREQTIGYCLDSVLNQTCDILEVVVVDDCSSDESVQFLRDYPDPRVRCIALEKDSGAQAARNRGILEAKGDWIAFQDSDDEWDPRKLERQLEALRKVNFDPMSVVHTDCWRYVPTTGAKSLWSLPRIDGVDVYRQLLSAPGTLFPTMLTSKAALEKIGLLDTNVNSYQEWDTSIRLSEYCRFIHLQEPLFIYHLHDGETISKDSRRDIAGYQYIVDKFKDEIVKHCGMQTLNNHLRNNAIKAMHWGYYQEAEEFLKKTPESSLDFFILKGLARLKHSPDFYLRTKQLVQKVKSSLSRTLNPIMRSL